MEAAHLEYSEIAINLANGNSYTVVRGGEYREKLLAAIAEGKQEFIRVELFDQKTQILIRVREVSDVVITPTEI